MSTMLNAEPDGLKTLVIKPEARWQAIDVPELWQFRDLLGALAARDVKLRYRQTALGVLWVVLQPLMAAGIFAVVFGRIAHLPSHGIPYFVFAYAGLLGWNAFNSTLTKSANCLVGNAQLVSKIYFPRLILPLSTVVSTLIDFGVAFVVMLALLLFNHIAPHWGILLLPVWLALLLLLSLGVGTYAAALMVSYRDIQYVLPVVMQFLLYASPVAYALSTVPRHLKWLFAINPMTGVLEAFRWSLLGQGTLNTGALLYSAVAALVLFAAGALSFKSMERRFADVI